MIPKNKKWSVSNMRKISIIIIIFLFLIICGCKYNNYLESENIPESENILEYSEYSEGYYTFNPNLFYKVQSYDKYQQISKVYKIKEQNYDGQFFNENGLIIFSISETKGLYRHELSFNIIDDTLDVEYNRITSPGGTDDIKYWTIIVTIDIDKLNRIEKVKVKDIELKSDDAFQTNMPMGMPDDFSFNYMSYDGTMFNSKDGSYRKTINSNKQTVDLSKEELEAIYAKLRNANADRYNGSMYLNDESSQSSPSLLFQFNDVRICFYGVDNPNYEWASEMELYNIITEIIESYIIPKTQDN